MMKYISVFLLLTLLSQKGMANTSFDESNSNLLTGDGPAGDTEFIAPKSGGVSQAPSQAFSEKYSSPTDEIPSLAADGMSGQVASENTNGLNQIDSSENSVNPLVRDEASTAIDGSDSHRVNEDIASDSSSFNASPQIEEPSIESAQQSQPLTPEELEHERYREQANQLLVQEARRENLVKQRVQDAAQDSLQGHLSPEMDSVTSNSVPERKSQSTELDHALLREKIRIAKAKIAEMEAEERALTEAMDMNK